MPAPKPRETSGRLAAMDLLRLFAAVSVVIFHYSTPGAVYATKANFGHFRALSQFGFLGVELFFIISGFVILMTAWGKTIPQFVASRVSRLLPAFLVAVVGTYVLLIINRLVGRGDGDLSPLKALTNLTLYIGAEPTQYADPAHWSLYVEALFYIVIAVFIKVGITRNRILVFCFLMPILGGLTGDSWISYLFLHHWAGLFSAGMILYLVYKEGWTLPSVLILIHDLAFAMSFVHAENVGSAQLQMVRGVKPELIAALLVPFCFAAVAVTVLTPLARINWPAFTWLGKITYPLYAIHYSWGLTIILYYLLPFMSGMQATWVGFAIVFVLAILINVLVEETLQRPLRKMMLRHLTEPTPATAVGAGGATRAVLAETPVETAAAHTPAAQSPAAR